MVDDHRVRIGEVPAQRLLVLREFDLAEPSESQDLVVHYLKQPKVMGPPAFAHFKESSVHLGLDVLDTCRAQEPG